MTLLGLIILLIVVGVVLWLVNTYIPMASNIKMILNVVVVVVVIAWLMQASGLTGTLSRPIPTIK